MRRSALLPVVLLLAILAPAAHALPKPTSLRPLHAEPDPEKGGRIVDDRGREVLLRGANVNSLAEYWKGTRFQTTFPLERRDPRRMGAIGWSAVRLLLSWSRVEPRPGEYDDAYLAQAKRIVSRLAKVGIYTIVDMHQDAWGATLAARPNEICAPPTAPALGWDGAPGWATFDGGLPRCYTQAREFSPAVRQAWQSFLTDEEGPGGVGIQTRYVAMWRHVARFFGRHRAVAGYDLMNEPNTLPSDDPMLSEMYARALKAVRAGERDAGGRRHLVLFEPSGLWSAIGRGAPPDFERDRDVVYAPHIYTGGFDGGPITRDAFEVAREEAKRFGGAPVLSGEWGADPDRPKDPSDTYFLDHQRFQDELRFGATLWTWRESCGDPHKVGDYRSGNDNPKVWGEFDVDCRSNAIKGPRLALMNQLTRAYVRAAPGRLDSTSYDQRTGVLTASGEAPATATTARRKRKRKRRRLDELVAFYPRHKHGGIRVTLRGLRRKRIVRAPNGGRVIGAEPRGGAWSITVAPR